MQVLQPPPSSLCVQAHDSPVRAMTWSHNDMWMLTADHGGYVKYWQSNMNNVKMFQAHKEAIREARFLPNLPFSVAQTLGGRCLPPQLVLCLLWYINDRCKRVLQHCTDLLLTLCLLSRVSVFTLPPDLLNKVMLHLSRFGSPAGSAEGQ